MWGWGLPIACKYQVLHTLIELQPILLRDHFENEAHTKIEFSKEGPVPVRGIVGTTPSICTLKWQPCTV